MIFGKKDTGTKCVNCKFQLEDSFNFCPYCGNSTMDEKQELNEFGLLGRNDFSKPVEKRENPLENLGISDKLLNTLMNNVMKSFGNQFKDMAEADFNNQNNTSIEHLPNGIKIRVGIPNKHQNKQQKPKQSPKRQITEEQIGKMSNLPRTIAKTSVRRLSDKVVYELSAPGIESPEDVFISKLESGYEIKAIGKKKVYVNSLQIDLPLKGYSLTDKKLFVEFKPENNSQ